MVRLYLTYCSRNKNNISKGTPEQLYSSNRIIKFIALCKSRKLNWAILSAKYGLFFPNEIHKNYDVTFKTVNEKCRIVENGKLILRKESDERIAALIRKIRNQMREREVKEFIFFVDKPWIRKKCYLFILHATVDNCSSHKRWNGIVEHIMNLYENGKGKIKLISSLTEI